MSLLAGSDGIFWVFITQWSWFAKTYVILLSPLSFVGFYCLYRFWRERTEETRKLFWVGICICQIKLFGNVTFFIFDYDLYLAEKGLAVIEVVKIIEACRGPLTLNYFSNKILTFELVKSRKGRTVFILTLGIESLVFVLCNLADSEYIYFKEAFVSFMVVFGFFGSILLNAFFLLALYKLNSLNQQAIHLEISENKKYKFMFNSIQDAIFLIENVHIKFMNSLAGAIFKDRALDDGQESEIDIPVFFFF